MVPPQLQKLYGTIANLEASAIEGSVFTHSDVKPGMLVKAKVISVVNFGAIVQFPSGIKALCPLPHMSELDIVKPAKKFKVGAELLFRVLGCKSKRITVTHKKTLVKSKLNVLSSYADATEGLVTHGWITKIKKHGCFVKFYNGVQGFAHRFELALDPGSEADAVYHVGQVVKCRIISSVPTSHRINLSFVISPKRDSSFPRVENFEDLHPSKKVKVDEERRRISLGMKKSYVRDATDVQTVSSHIENNEPDDGSAAFFDSLHNLEQNGFSPSAERIFEEGNAGSETFLQAEPRASVLPLQVSLDDSEGSDMDVHPTIKQDCTNENGLVAKKSSRREKKKAKEDREIEINAAEERNLQKDIPRTEEEYEKLVRSSPNSSFVWVQYMAFMESLADVEKARSIAERALRTINFREEMEKLNVWTAYFNLENQYGNPPEEAVKKIFQRAVQFCDPKKAHLAVLALYERTEQHKLVEDLLERMTKKFKTSCKIWLHRVQFLLRQGKDGVQSIVNRALLSLARKKHIKFISQTAVLEYKCGVPDRGRSMFEGILREYPKRTDLWGVYLDQEIRLGDPEQIRILFDKATSLSLPPKKIEFLFKKYLNYEKSQGDEERVEYVKRRAIEYAESLK